MAKETSYHDIDALVQRKRWRRRDHGGGFGREACDCIFLINRTPFGTWRYVVFANPETYYGPNGLRKMWNVDYAIDRMAKRHNDQVASQIRR